MNNTRPMKPLFIPSQKDLFNNKTRKAPPSKSGSPIKRKSLHNKTIIPIRYEKETPYDLFFAF